MKDQPLVIEIQNDELRIRIGVDRLAFCTKFPEWNNPYDAEKGDFKRLWRVTDPDTFAKAVRDALGDEGEDGSTPVTKLLDQAAEAAIEDGCEGVEEWTGDIDW